MALSENINTREFDKFADDVDLGTVVKVLAKIAGGAITILSPDDFLVTTLDITNVATKLPATAAPGRISIDIRNLADPSSAGDANKIIYVGPTAAVTADAVVGTTSGRQIGPGEGDNIELRDNKEPWAIAPAGVTVRVQVTEWIVNP